MRTISEKVNQVLSAWDPIQVGSQLAPYEYTDYIQRLERILVDKKALFSELQGILQNEMGLEFDPENESHLSDLNLVIEALYKVGAQ